MFRNNGLNVRPLAPISLNVEAVNRGLNRAAIPGTGRQRDMSADGPEHYSGLGRYVGRKLPAVGTGPSLSLGLASDAWPPVPRKVARRWQTCFLVTMIGSNLCPHLKAEPAALADGVFDSGE